MRKALYLFKFSEIIWHKPNAIRKENYLSLKNQVHLVENNKAKGLVVF